MANNNRRYGALGYLNRSCGACRSTYLTCSGSNLFYEGPCGCVNNGCCNGVCTANQSCGCNNCGCNSCNSCNSCSGTFNNRRYNNWNYNRSGSCGCNNCSNCYATRSGDYSCGCNCGCNNCGCNSTWNNCNCNNCGCSDCGCDDAYDYYGQTAASFVVNTPVLQNMGGPLSFTASGECNDSDYSVCDQGIRLHSGGSYSVSYSFENANGTMCPSPLSLALNGQEVYGSRSYARNHVLIEANSGDVLSLSTDNAVNIPRNSDNVPAVSLIITRIS